MRRLIYFATIALLILPMIGVFSCSPKEEYEIKPVPIHELKISFAESFPVQVMLYIKGGLADGATKLNEIKILGHTGNTLDVSVTTKRLKGAIAIQVYGYFEENVNLGSDFKSGETYTVKVNDQTVSFKMQ